MDHPNDKEDALFSQNPPPYSEKQSYSQQLIPADGLANSAMPTQYQPYYAPYGAVPSSGPDVRPPLHSTVVFIPPTDAPDHLAYSISTMLCCFLPLGIAAVVYSVRTRDANRMGNSTEAQRNSRMARILARSALSVGIVLFIIATILSVLYLLISQGESTALGRKTDWALEDIPDMT
ncbi:PREDICTED: interferon-induced transmembrane protein 2-like [Gekko japonicus]|uniref:Interferon-induced transmembrane protein 2-like n=1 Tax=Gekko japonicus TaxID=146911 RepID=A0ABM1KIN2_GEKJA|nr:PREDICTED: interferon-induced transmembrane protein 2-like [Gekko japonicus]